MVNVANSYMFHKDRATSEDRVDDNFALFRLHDYKNMGDQHCWSPM